jgi:hypothetical protein
MTIALKLFSTSACHLCETAEALLVRINHQKISWDVIEISEDELLLSEYGSRIPVLINTANGESLNWPFNEAQVIELAYSHCNTADG